MKNLFAAFKDNLKYISLALTAILCVVIVYLNAAAFGIGVTADSINYLSIAKNISKSFSFYTSVTEWNYPGVQYWNGYWPPLYPILLIIPAVVGGNFLLIIFNGLLLGITFILSYKLLARISPSKNELILFIVFLIVFSKWLIWIFCYVWSETVFIPLVLGYLLLLDDLVSNRTDRNFIKVIVVTCLLSLTRYIGIFFFIPIVLFTLPSFFLFRIKRMLYLGLAVLPFFIVLLINYHETSKFFGVRLSSNGSFFNLINTISTGINKWILGTQGSPAFEVVTSIVFVMILLGSFVLALKQKNGVNKIIVVTVAIYLLAIFSSALTERLEKFGFRFISPIYIPIALLIFSFLFHLKKRLFYLILISLFVVSGAVLVQFVLNNNYLGIGVFATKEWESSATLEFLRTNSEQRIIYSNYAEAINYYTDKPTKIITDEKELINQMLTKIKLEHALIVIINSNTRQQPDTIELIKKAICNQPQTKLADGIVYYF